MSTASPPLPPGGFVPKFHPRILGSAAPVFPGFEVDILDRVPDDERQDAVWHRERAKAMLKAHPEIKSLFGNDPATAFWCLAAASTQLGIAVAVGYAPWWVMLLAAWLVGSSINIMLFQLGHECVHGLVFQRKSWNRVMFTLTTLPMFLSGHHTWWEEHLVHHNDMGAKKDFITRRRSYFLATRLTSPLVVPYSLLMLVMQVLRSTLGLLMYCGGLLLGHFKPTPRTLAVLADEHLVSGYRKDGSEMWAVCYPLLNLTTCGMLLLLGGWQSVAYLLASQAFFTGFLHPYCLGWVLGISHFHGARRYQPTASHYGWLINLLSFNAGYHVEHHDLMTIPWRQMPALRRMAPEFYDNLEPIRSYTWLAMQFVFAWPQYFEANFNHEAHRNAARFQGEQAA
ncbi:MAG TPA: fatty acid desaturase [Pirellulaceae bacterium]|nr:fatty acid desaturase [Pirellulaceae bacterium]